MTEPEKLPEKPVTPDKPPGKGDMVALGVGCAVFLIMFVAIVLVGMGQR